MTTTAFDPLNRPVAVTQNALAGQPQNHQQQYNLVTQYGYDAAGNRTVVTDTLGSVTRTAYDLAGRPAAGDGQRATRAAPEPPGRVQPDHQLRL